MSLGSAHNTTLNNTEEEALSHSEDGRPSSAEVRKRNRSTEHQDMSEDSRRLLGMTDGDDTSSDQSSSSGPPPKVARRRGASRGGGGEAGVGRDEDNDEKKKKFEGDDSEDEELDMYWACRKGKVKRITQLVEEAGDDSKGVLSEAVHPRGSTPILVASYFDQAEAVAYLLERGADPAPRPSNQTALHLAAHRGSCKAARTLLWRMDTPYTIDVDVTNDEEETPLFVAAYANQADMVKLLVDAGADLERPSGTNGQRPLHIAAELGSVACLTFLLSRGAQVDAVDASGETALYKATEADRLGSVIVLLRNGADASARVPEHGRFPLFAACERGRDLDIVAALAGNSSDLDQPTDNGYTSLYVAARYNLADVVRLLLAQGADPNFVNKYGETPLFAACRENHEAVVKVLLKHKDTRINCSSSRWAQGTPLHVAAALDHLEISRRLLQHNADLRTVARDPASLLHVVCSNGFLGGFTLNYADIDLCDSDGFAPLALALQNNNVELARLLFIEYHAQPPINCDELLPEGRDDRTYRGVAAGAHRRSDDAKKSRSKLFNRIVRYWRRRMEMERASREGDAAEQTPQQPQQQQQQQLSEEEQQLLAEAQERELQPLDDESDADMIF